MTVDPVREEAENLVAALVVLASNAARGLGAASERVAGGGFATESAECCICPICRVIAAMRNPDPRFTERLATGVGDFADGVASLLRSLQPPAGAPAADQPSGPASAADPASPPETSAPSAPSAAPAAPGEAAIR